MSAAPTTDGWEGLSTSTISDALDRHGLSGQALGVHAAGNGTRVLGPAFTVRMLPTGIRPGTVGDYVDEVPPGHVVVIDNAGRTDVTVWGDLLTAAALRRGVAGTVIHGACRDTAVIGERYPLFVRGRTMRTGKGRVELAELGAAVSLGTVRVEPGDLVVGDNDGLVIVPSSCVETVLTTALAIDSIEEQIRNRVAAGARLADARADLSYHRLQSPETVR